MRAAFNLAWNITFTSLATTKMCEKCGETVLICISKCICDLSGFNSVRLTTVKTVLKEMCVEERRKRKMAFVCFSLLVFFPQECNTAKSQATVNRFQVNGADCDCAPSVYLILFSEKPETFYTNFVNQPLKYNNILHKNWLLLQYYRLICMHPMISTSLKQVMDHRCLASITPCHF